MSLLHIELTSRLQIPILILNLNLNSVNSSGSPTYIMQNVLELYIIEENLLYHEVVYVKMRVKYD